MRKTAKAYILFIFCLFLVLAFYPVASDAKEADLTINGEYLSANLKGTSLNAIFEALQREKGIWFKGDLSLLDAKITVQFKDHSLEDGIKRILASINHCLVFKSDGALVGVILFGKGKDEPASAQYTAEVTKNTIPLRVKKKNINPGRNNEADMVMDGPPISRSTLGSKQNLKDFKILTNTNSQNPPAKMTPEQQLEILKVLRDQPPQGSPAEMTAEQIANMKAMRDQQPQNVPNK
jgi:hypothetical protein